MLRAASDDSAASWIGETIGSFGDGVRALVPPVFEAYARILHPAWAAGRVPVRWATIAAWSGGSAHAMAEFEPMARERGRPSVPRPFTAPPDDGALPPAALEALSDVLARHTTTPDRCHFGLWEGYGWIGWMAVEMRPAAKLGLPNRTYLLFEGPLVAISELGWREDLSNGSLRMRALDRRSIGFRERARALVWPNKTEKVSQRPPAPSDATLHRESPNLIWPADRTWFVVSEIDLDSTFVGGSTELINDLLADSRLEAWPASAADPVTANSDVLNRPS
jgi:hypothetical protein